MRRLFTVMLLIALGGCVDGPRQDQILVFAAASLEDALVEVARAFSADAGVPISFNFAGSNALAQQIRAGAQADLFLSADRNWMDFLEREDLLLPGTRVDLLGNQLVVVAHPESTFSMSRLEDLAGGGFRHLSLGDPDAVPVGRYTRALLEKVRVGDRDVWQEIEHRVVPAVDVRAALGLVEQEPSAIGIVYRTDILRRSKVRLVYEVPGELGPPIRYAAALVGGRHSESPAPAALLAFLAGPQAKDIFRSWGFEPLS